MLLAINASMFLMEAVIGWLAVAICYIISSLINDAFEV
jgi:hypothetical protein